MKSKVPFGAGPLSVALVVGSVCVLLGIRMLSLSPDETVTMSGSQTGTFPITATYVEMQRASVSDPYSATGKTIDITVLDDERYEVSQRTQVGGETVVDREVVSGTERFIEDLWGGEPSEEYTRFSVARSGFLYGVGDLVSEEEEKYIQFVSRLSPIVNTQFVSAGLSAGYLHDLGESEVISRTARSIRSEESAAPLAISGASEVYTVTYDLETGLKLMIAEEPRQHSGMRLTSASMVVFSASLAAGTAELPDTGRQLTSRNRVAVNFLGEAAMSYPAASTGVLSPAVSSPSTGYEIEQPVFVSETFTTAGYETPGYWYVSHDITGPGSREAVVIQGQDESLPYEFSLYWPPDWGGSAPPGFPTPESVELEESVFADVYSFSPAIRERFVTPVGYLLVYEVEPGLQMIALANDAFSDADEVASIVSSFLP